MGSILEINSCFEDEWFTRIPFMISGESEEPFLWWIHLEAGRSARCSRSAKRDMVSTLNPGCKRSDKPFQADMEIHKKLIVCWQLCFEFFPPSEAKSFSRGLPASSPEHGVRLDELSEFTHSFSKHTTPKYELFHFFACRSCLVQLFLCKLMDYFMRWIIQLTLVVN